MPERPSSPESGSFAEAESAITGGDILFDLPDLDSGPGQEAMRIARRASFPHHKASAEIAGVGGNHAACLSRRHRSGRCMCCSMCEQTVRAMLVARKGRKEFKDLPFLDYYTQLCEMDSLEYTEFVKKFGTKQPNYQWVEEGEDRLAPRFEPPLPANPRNSIMTSKKLEAILELWPDQERAAIATYVLAEAAVLCRRREFTGDNYGPFRRWGYLGDEAVKRMRLDLGWDGPELTRDEVEELMRNVADSLDSAPKSHATKAAFLKPRLHRWVFSHLGIDASTDQMMEIGGREVDAIPAFGGQDSEARRIRDDGDLHALIVKAVLRVIDTPGRFREGAPDARERTVGAFVKAQLRREATLVMVKAQLRRTAIERGFEPEISQVDRVARDDLMRFAPSIATEVRLVLAGRDAEAEIASSGATSVKERAAIRVWKFAEWGIVLGEDT